MTLWRSQYFHSNSCLTVNRVALHTTLSHIPYADGVSWRPELGCLAGTREIPIEQIWSWIERADASKPAEVLLVAEVAGAGKTALSHELGRRCDKAGVLKTAFFFSHDKADLGTATKFTGTLIRDLCSVDHFAQSVCRIIDQKPSIASNSPSEQFEELIVEPSSLLPTDKPIVVIIDAFDECSKDLDVLLEIFKESVPKLPGNFRFLVTSRPTPEISNLSELPHFSRQPLALDEGSNLTDIRMYITQHLTKVFGKEVDSTMVDRFTVATEGLFVWISTVFAQVRGAINPKKALEDILNKNSSRRVPVEHKMGELYSSILDAQDWYDPDFVEAYQTAMGMILTAKDPLPLSVFVQLNPTMSPDLFATVVERLQSVLYYSKEPNQPIRLLHNSFHEFMVICPQDRPYHIVISDHEQAMTLFCLNLLNRELKLPIPGTGYLGGEKKDEENYKQDDEGVVFGIPRIDNESVSAGLWYCCQFVVGHCVSISVPSEDLSAALRVFLQLNLVRWIEICASKGSFMGFDTGFLTWAKVCLLFMDAHRHLILPRLHCLMLKNCYTRV